jgi:hypothetical protein
MRIIALLFAFVLAGCTGNRLNAETSTIAVAAPAPPVAAAFAAMGCGGPAEQRHGRGWRGPSVAEFDDGRFEALTSTDGRSLSKSSG